MIARPLSGAVLYCLHAQIYIRLISGTAITVDGWPLVF